MRINGAREATTWEAQVASAHTSGHISVPGNLPDGTLQLTFDHLRVIPIERDGEPATQEKFDPRAIPDVDFSAEQFIFRDIKLGRADMRTRRAPDGLTLEHLTFEDSGFTLQAAGDWLLQNDQQTSRFNIDLSGRSLAGILDRFGYNVANVKDGETTMSINAIWPDTPVAFSLARMTGNFELHVADGSILECRAGQWSHIRIVKHPDVAAAPAA